MPDKRKPSQSEKLDIFIGYTICLALFVSPPDIANRLNPVLAFLPIAIERIQKRSKD